MLTLLAALPLIFPVDEVHQEHHPDGSLALEVEMAKNRRGELVRNGKYRRLSPDGTELAVGRYKDGEATGKWTFNHDNGKVFARGYFKDDLATKKWFFKRADGEKWAEGVCADGYRTGEWQFFDARGKPDDESSGVFSYVEERWPNGAPRHRGALRNGLPHGAWESFWSDGSPMMGGLYIHGERAGDWMLTHADGTADPAVITGTIAAPDWPHLPRPDGAPQVLEPGAGSLPLFSAFEDEGDTIGELVNGLVDGDARERALALKSTITRLDTFVPALIDNLSACDLTDAAEAAKALRWNSALAVVCGNRDFGWTGSAEADRMSVRRWHTLWAATQDSVGVWRLRLTVKSAGGELALGTFLQPGLGSSASPFPKNADKAIVQGINAALDWLIAHQAPNGSWSGDKFSDQCGKIGEGKCDGAGFKHDGGLTGLALLTFARAGHTLDGGEHADVVAAGVGYLMSTMGKNGMLGDRSSHDHIYNHTAALLGISEALGTGGLNRYPELRVPLQSAVDVLEQARNDEPVAGWRYDFKPQGDIDTSITCWALHALASARRAGLDVHPFNFESADDTVDEMTDPATGRVGYDAMGSFSARTMLNMEDYPHDGEGHAMTSAGILIRFLTADALGREPKAEMLKLHANLIATPPSWEPRSQRDMYYWSWGAQAAHRIGGKVWSQWKAAIKPELLYNQESGGDAKGSWAPTGAWGYAGGRIYSTAFITLALIEAAKG